MYELDIKMERFLKQSYKRGLGDIHTLSTQNMRNFLLPSRPLSLSIISQDYLSTWGCKIRCYHPNNHPNQPKRAVFYLPANGFFIDRLGLNDEFCYFLANRLNRHVFAIYHRLVPEFKFPAYIWDTYHTILELFKNSSFYNFISEDIVLWGESSGASIGLTCQHLLKKNQLSIFSKQVIFYPMTDLLTPFDSKRRFGQGFAMDAPFIEWMATRMLKTPQERSNPLVSPNLFQEFENLPSSLMIFSGFDYFKDEGLDYAQKLKAAKVPLEMKIYTQMIHGFLRFFPKHPVTLEAFEYACNYISPAPRP